MDKDLYEILGVKKSATESEIRKAFLKLAKKHHPDVNQGNKDAEQKFKEVNFAYEVLKDPKKRAHYDQMRAAGANPFAQAAGAGAGSWRSAGGGFGAGEAYNDFGLGDLFQEIFGGGFSSAGGFGGFGGAQGREGRRAGGFGQRRGADQEASVTINFLDAARGAEQTLTLSDGRRLTVKIPEGVDTGSKIKLTGQGQPGQGGAPSGDLVLTLNVAPHATFTREGQDVVVRLPITFSEAVLGGEVDVPTLDGKVVMKIPKGVSSGQRLKLGGKGIRSPKSGTKGDQFVELLIKVPKDDPAYAEAAEKLRSVPFHPRGG